MASNNPVYITEMKIIEKHYTHEVCIRNAHKILVVKSADKAYQKPGSKNLFMLTICHVCIMHLGNTLCTEQWLYRGAGWRERRVLLWTTDWASHGSEHEDLTLDGLAHCYQQLAGTCFQCLHLEYKREVMCMPYYKAPQCEFVKW